MRKESDEQIHEIQTITVPVAVICHVQITGHNKVQVWNKTSKTVYESKIAFVNIHKLDMLEKPRRALIIQLIIYKCRVVGRDKSYFV